MASSLARAPADGDLGGEEAPDLLDEDGERWLAGLQDVIAAVQRNQLAAGNQRVQLLGLAERPHAAHRSGHRVPASVSPTPGGPARPWHRGRPVRPSADRRAAARGAALLTVDAAGRPMARRAAAEAVRRPTCQAPT